MNREEMMAYATCHVIDSYPKALAKACDDNFDYIVGLKCGTIIYFKSATPVSAEWVVLNEPKMLRLEKEYIPEIVVLDRGVEVRVSDISYVIDAPFGS